MPEPATASQSLGRSVYLFVGAIGVAIAVLLWPVNAPAPEPATPGQPPASSGTPQPESEPAETPGYSPRRIRWADVEVPETPKDLASLAKMGADLYKQQCAVCHGDKGKGDGVVAPMLEHRPRDYTRGNFKFKTSAVGEMPFDDDLYRTITSGVPAAGMPSFGDLREEDRWALVAYVKKLSEKEFDDGEVLNFFELRPATTRLTYDVSNRQVTPDAVKRGREIFTTEKGGCVLCHGPEGLGNGISAKDLKDDADLPIHPRNLTRGEVEFKTGSQPSDIFRILANGMAGTPMPSFRANLTDDERWDAACFVTSLFKPIPPGEQLFLRVGCKSCHTIGAGKLIGPDLAGVTTRRDGAWLKRWLKDPPTMIATDPEAKKLLEEYLTPMPSYGLTNKEIDLLIDYLRDAKPSAQK